MKSVCVCFLLLAVSTALAADSVLYRLCKNFVGAQNMWKAEGKCPRSFKQGEEAACNDLENFKPPYENDEQERNIMMGVMGCRVTRCELTDEYCESNKATLDRLSPKQSRQ
uniref:Uncharacterized protein n=1 Tax=Bursaphelenchus xylophilus TaxID=6326 RepID=A0A1I7RID4_BURXY